MNFISILLIIGLCILALWLFNKFFKVPKTPALNFINGGVKTFKSGFTLYLARVEYKRQHIRWRFRKFFQQLFHKMIDEEPLFYSNIPVGWKYVKLTKNLLLRKERFAFKSVVFVDEMALLADKDMYKILDADNLNDLKEFFKLFGHETHGGSFFSNSQALGDVTVEFRRNIAQYFYIHDLVKWIPFFFMVNVREERYSEDGSAIMNMYAQDIEESMKKVLIPKSICKRYDQYCYSILTDDLPVQKTIVDGRKLKNFKTNEILSFKRRKK